MNTCIPLMASTLLAASLISGTAHAVSVSGQGTWESTLQGRDLDGNLATFEAYYDTDLNITWLADANLIGMADWYSAQSQIAVLNSGNYLGFNDWRLPDTPSYDSTCQASGTNGTGCTGSELGHLFYEVLGGAQGSSILTVHNENFTLFSNIQSGFYWSGTESPVYPGPFTYRFDVGVQDASKSYSSGYYSWVVRTGDVAPVPEASTYAMFLAGLGLVGFMANRRKAA
jgi:hypothetical protein